MASIWQVVTVVTVTGYAKLLCVEIFTMRCKSIKAKL